jgi:hypothetical protein
MVENRFLKRLSKKARKGLRGWPIATIAFYGPNLRQATKVAVGIVPSENAEVEELRDWKVERGDIRADSGIAGEILEFIEQHQVRSVAMTDGIIGCPHQEGIDYEGEWCPVCQILARTRPFYGAEGPLRKCAALNLTPAVLCECVYRTKSSSIVFPLLFDC